VFLDSSRYSRLRKDEARTKNGRVVKVVTLRRLPAVSGDPTIVKENDSLDAIAQRLYDNPTMFWHIGDANTKLQTGDLIGEPGRTINVPEQ
jgi:hypothetical protein